jgi:energy-coupling factor transporter ATP-binding protein EcfA2
MTRAANRTPEQVAAAEAEQARNRREREAARSQRERERDQVAAERRSARAAMEDALGPARLYSVAGPACYSVMARNLISIVASEGGDLLSLGLLPPRAVSVRLTGAERDEYTENELALIDAGATKAEAILRACPLVVGPDDLVWRRSAAGTFEPLEKVISGNDSPLTRMIIELCDASFWPTDNGDLVPIPASGSLKLEVANRVRAELHARGRQVAVDADGIRRADPHRFTGRPLVEGVDDRMVFAFSNGLVVADAACAGRPALYPFGDDLWLTATLPIAFDPALMAAPEPLVFSTMLRNAFTTPRDAMEAIEVIRQAIASGLSLGDAVEKIVLITGASQCGKSTLIELLRMAAGSYVTGVSMRDFGASRAADRSTALHACTTAGMVLEAEADFGDGKSAQSALATLKSVGAHDTISYVLPFGTRKTTAKLRALPMIAGNMPGNGMMLGLDASGALAERLCVINCVKGMAGRQDPAVKRAAMAADQRSILLHWALRGAVSLASADWRMFEPKDWREAKQKVLAGTAPLAHWMADCIEFTGNMQDFVPLAQLTLSALVWAEQTQGASLSVMAPLVYSKLHDKVLTEARHREVSARIDERVNYHRPDPQIAAIDGVQRPRIEPARLRCSLIRGLKLREFDGRIDAYADMLDAIQKKLVHTENGDTVKIPSTLRTLQYLPEVRFFGAQLIDVPPPEKP